jgi:hypothetical protein
MVTFGKSMVGCCRVSTGIPLSSERLIQKGVPPEYARALADGILHLAQDPLLRAKLGARDHRLCQVCWGPGKKPWETFLGNCRNC